VDAAALATSEMSADVEALLMAAEEALLRAAEEF
jgi:hypothetical protein